MTKQPLAMDSSKPFAKHPLVFEGLGTYYPHIVGDRVTWRLDDTGDVLCGVNVESISNVKRFATLAKIVNVQEAR